MFHMGMALKRKLEAMVDSAPLRNKDLSRFDIAISRTGHDRWASYEVELCPPEPLKKTEYEQAIKIMANMVAEFRPNGQV